MRRSSSSSSSGLEFDLHAQARRRLVDEVDRLVGQEAVGDVAVGKDGSGDERGIGDAHAVMQLVFLLEPAQDGDRVLDRRLRHEDRLEAARECCVLLHMLAVFVERGRADAMQLAAGERGLEQIGGVHRAVRLAGADQRMHLVDKEDDLPFRRLHFGEHGFQALLELAAIFRAGDERAQVEGEDLLLFQAFRYVALHDAIGEAFDDGGLADAGLADQHGVVLGAAGQHLDRAADLLVAPDHGIELALRCGLREVAGVALQRVIGLLRAGTVCGAALAQLRDRGVERAGRDPGIGEDALRLRFLRLRQRLQDALHGDEAVARLGRVLLGGIQHPLRRRRHIDLARAAAHLRQLAERGLGQLQRFFRLPARTRDEPRGKPLRIVEQHLQEMLRRDLRVAFAVGEALRRLQEAFETVGKFFEIHGSSLFGRPGLGRPK